MVAAVIVSKDAGESAYPMFEVHDFSRERAFFAGPLFLEVGEEFTVELSSGGAERARACARVVSLTTGDMPGMVVALSELSESDCRLIETWAARAAES